MMGLKAEGSACILGTSVMLIVHQDIYSFSFIFVYCGGILNSFLIWNISVISKPFICHDAEFICHFKIIYMQAI